MAEKPAKEGMPAKQVHCIGRKASNSRNASKAGSLATVGKPAIPGMQAKQARQQR
jgi:hypothetical protein